jgi:hypothetical protein
MTELLTLEDLDTFFETSLGSTTRNHTWLREYTVAGVPLWVRENPTHFEFVVSGTPELKYFRVSLGKANISRTKDLKAIGKEVSRRLITQEVKDRYADIVTRYKEHLDYTTSKETIKQRCHELLGEKYRPDGYNNHRTSDYKRGISINVENPTSVKLTFEVHPDLVEQIIDFRESLRK